jgi:hypothetical protein
VRTPTAYDSGRHYAEAGLTPNWAGLWVSGRLAEFSRGYEAVLAERRQASTKASSAAPRRSGRA